MAAASALGLRERKKLRTKQTIVDVSTRLFLEQGYNQTTLAQVAEESEVALSTFFNYFPTKVDLVFCFFDEVIESARTRIVDRPEGEGAIDAIESWIREVLPGVEHPYENAIRRMPEIIAGTPELEAEERLRFAFLEDALAEGFARDLGESARSMHARVLASMALHGMDEVWRTWWEKHVNDAELGFDDALTAKADYVVELLRTGLGLVRSLPAPPA